MRKIIVIALLFISSTAFGLTTKINQNHLVYTAPVIVTTTTNSVTDTFPFGPFSTTSFQCAWASVTGTNPVYILQVTNDGTNWDDVSGATTTITSTSGSETWIVSPLPVKSARIKVSTASTTGTLDCIAIPQGAK